MALPIQRMTYKQAMDDYGIDRPDLRFDMKLKDITEIAKGTGYKVFVSTIEKGGVVKGLCVKGGGEKYSRSDIEQTLTRFVGDFGARGLSWCKVKDEGGQRTLTLGSAKFFNPAQQQQLIDLFGAADGDLLMFVADQEKAANKALAPLRCKIAREMKLYDEKEYRFVWIVDFPLMEWNPEEGRFDSVHHPFTAPVPEDLDRLEMDPGNIRAQAYDLVLNGYEIGGGSIRIHRMETQRKIFRLLKITDAAGRGPVWVLPSGLGVRGPAPRRASPSAWTGWSCS